MNAKDLVHAVTAMFVAEHEMIFLLSNGREFRGYVEPDNIGETVLIMNDHNPTVPDNVMVQTASIIAVYLGDYVGASEEQS